MSHRPMARSIVVMLALTVAACSDDSADDATTQACERWDAIAGSDTSDAEAASELNEIADLSTNANVTDKAEALAIALEGDVTQTEVGQAFEDMDAACQVAVD